MRTGFIFMLDSYNDQQSVYEFMVNSYGVQGDLIMIDQGDGSYPDFIWESTGKNNNKGHNVQITMPLKSSRFIPGKEVEIGIYFDRHIPCESKKRLYPSFNPLDGDFLNQMGSIIFNKLNYDELLPSNTQNYKLENKRGNLTQSINETNFCFTGKIRLTSIFTYDTTYNLDFRQVESFAGQLDVNLRANIYYKEKRPFG